MAYKKGKITEVAPVQQEKEQHSSVVDVVYDLYTTNGNEENYNE